MVCDIQMPGMDGIAATKRVVEADGPPVLILTTYDTQADILAAVEAGAMGYLLKDSPSRRCTRPCSIPPRTAAPWHRR